MGLKSRLLSQSTVIFGARIMGAGLIFLAQAAIARFWGATVLGEYLLLIAAVNILAMIMPLGFNSVGTFFASEYRARGQTGNLWRFLRRSYVHIGAAGIVIGVLAAIGAGWLTGEYAFAAGLWVPVTVMAASTALIFVNSSVLVGLKQPFAGFFADGVFRPILILSSILIIMGIGGGVPGFDPLVWTLAVGYVLIAVVQMVLLFRFMRELPADAGGAAAESTRWWGLAAPWVLILLATDFLFDFDLLLLSGLMDKDMLAVFGVCTRIFALAAFGVTAVYAVSMPDFFESEANADREAFHRKLGDANLVAAGLAAVLFVGVAVFSPLVLMLFGPEFVSGAGPLMVLCLVLVVRAAFGPASLVLSINKRPWVSLPAIVGSIGILIVGNFVLVPPFGLMGAALSALLAISIWSVTLWIVARRTVGIDVSILPRLKLLFAQRFRNSAEAERS